MKRNITRTALALSVSLAALGLAAAPDEARADDCLLDTNNNGDVNLDDTDLGANSGGVNANLACGLNATATGSVATAVGSNSDATGTGTAAFGGGAQATANFTTAIGAGTNATAIGSSAIGNSA